MKARVITALIALVALLLVLFVAPPALVPYAIALVILAGAWEWSAFLQTEKSSLRLVYVLLIGALLALVEFTELVAARTVFLLALAGWVAALFWTFVYPTAVPAWLRWLGGVIVLVPMYLALVLLHASSPLLLLFALLIVWVADTGAYFAGRFFGRVKLAPQISPGKTWEGVFGGLLAVTALTLIWSLFNPVDLPVLVPFCLAIACISIVGDLTVSMFKRATGLKDSGKLFPGHGGVLDRVDSVAAAAPLFALGLGWAGLG